MQYRLLRNNKESGPYTTNQLLDLGLKPYDLLWADGKSASWQYASEIPELKAIAPVVEEQPYDRFFKKKEQKVSVVNTQKSKPRFRISAGKIVMVEEAVRPVETIFKEERLKSVASTQQAIASEPTPAAKPGWQEMYSEWKQPEEKVEEPVVITQKKTQSLDELKKQYEEKVLGKAEEKNESSSATRKQNIMAAVAILVLALGSFAGYKLKQNSEKPAVVEQAKPAVERAEVVGDGTIAGEEKPADNNAVNTAAKSNASQTAVTSPENAKEIKTPPQKAADANNAKQNVVLSAASKETAAQKIKPTVKDNVTVAKPALKSKENQPLATAKKTTPEIDKSKKTEPAKSTNATNNSTVKNTSPITDNVTLPAPKPVIKPSARKKISDYIAVRKTVASGSPTSVQNMHLSVENTSDFPIDLAVIDIQYFDQHGKYQKGETMYVKNINSGGDVDVRVPDSRNSKSITYKVSLVSAEQKTLYLVGD